MKTVQAVGWYLPDEVGGSEVYVAGLVRGLRTLGVQSVVAAPVDGDTGRALRHEGTEVFRYPMPAARTRAQLQGIEPPDRFDDFRRWLAAQEAQVYHQHSWTLGCGLHHLRAAKELGLRTFLTVHVPGPVCLRGSLLRDGVDPCDGLIEARRCAACWLRSRGLGPAWAQALAHVPAPVGTALQGWGRAGTALAATASVRLHAQRLRAAADHADRVIAVCGWLHEALRRNGVPQDKLLLNRQGIAHPPGGAAAALPRPADAALRVGFLGRWDPLKGLGLLLQALEALGPGHPVELHVRSPDPASATDPAWRDAVLAQAARLPGVHIGPALSPDDVPAFLRSVNLLAVPSQWLETGPLVVLEAFAAGVPVLGSDLGGIAELVRDGETGRLLPHTEPQAWANALADLCRDRDALARWRSGIGPVRTMDDVARDMIGLYRGVPASPGAAC